MTSHGTVFTYVIPFICSVVAPIQSVIPLQTIIPDYFNGDPIPGDALNVPGVPADPSVSLKSVYLHLKECLSLSDRKTLIYGHGLVTI